MLAAQRLEHFERGLRLTDDAMRGTQDESRTGVVRNDFEDLARLLRGENRLTRQQSGRMGQRDLNAPDRLVTARAHVEWLLLSRMHSSNRKTPD
jgi:hypothetical protein